jgi:hypothetical protein
MEGRPKKSHSQDKYDNLVTSKDVFAPLMRCLSASSQSKIVPRHFDSGTYSGSGAKTVCAAFAGTIIVLGIVRSHASCSIPVRCFLFASIFLSLMLHAMTATSQNASDHCRAQRRPLPTGRLQRITIHVPQPRQVLPFLDKRPR